MSGWGISDKASDKEKLKSKMADYLHGLNSCAVIGYDVYSEMFDFSMDLMDNLYELGKVELRAENEQLRDMLKGLYENRYELDKLCILLSRPEVKKALNAEQGE